MTNDKPREKRLVCRPALKAATREKRSAGQCLQHAHSDRLLDKQRTGQVSTSTLNDLGLLHLALTCLVDQLAPLEKTFVV